MGNTAHAVLVICDAVCLERNLHLVLQILAVTDNVILCVNLMNQAAKKGIHISCDILEKELHIPVIGITARRKREIRRLKTFLNTCMYEKNTVRQSFSEQNPRPFHTGNSGSPCLFPLSESCLPEKTTSPLL